MPEQVRESKIQTERFINIWDVFLNSGGYEVLDQGASRLMSDEAHFLFMCLTTLSLLLLTWQEGLGSTGGLFYKGTNSINESPTLMTKSPPKDPPPPNTSTLGKSFQQITVGENKHSVYSREKIKLIR